jgi:hypothetical protein
MTQVSAASLLAILLLSGCVTVQHSSADSYCLVSSGEPCAEVAGSGDCQPCPAAREL